MEKRVFFLLATGTDTFEYVEHPLGETQVERRFPVLQVCEEHAESLVDSQLFAGGIKPLVPFEVLEQVGILFRRVGDIRMGENGFDKRQPILVSARHVALRLHLDHHVYERSGRRLCQGEACGHIHLFYLGWKTVYDGLQQRFVAEYDGCLAPIGYPMVLAEPFGHVSGLCIFGSSGYIGDLLVFAELVV